MAEIFNFYVQDNRTIQFPKNNLLEPIMQEDYKVATWRFRIPKVLNGIDMSAWAWWFVYTNAKNEKFSELLTLVDDIDEPDSYYTADYSIDYGISYHPGNFQFSLEAINADSGGEVLNEWHTKTYAHKVDKTLQGNQAQWSETESDIISALIIEVQNKVAQLVGGATPEPKNLVADMTDPKKVYLYVGSEDGESTNYWYYHNGTRFVPGGLYGSGIIVDSTPTQGSNNAVSSGGVYEALHDTDVTLTHSGQAADAKVVGDKISDLKSALNEISDVTDNIFDMSVFDGVAGITKESNGYYKGTANAFNTAFANGISGLSFDANSRYYLSVHAYTDADSDLNTSVGLRLRLYDADNTQAAVIALRNDATTDAKYEVISTSGYSISKMTINKNSTPLNTWHIGKIMLIKSDSAVDYYPRETAFDRTARNNIINSNAQILKTKSYIKDDYENSQSIFFSPSEIEKGKIKNAGSVDEASETIARTIGYIKLAHPENTYVWSLSGYYVGVFEYYKKADGTFAYINYRYLILNNGVYVPSLGTTHVRLQFQKQNADYITDSIIQTICNNFIMREGREVNNYLKVCSFNMARLYSALSGADAEGLQKQIWNYLEFIGKFNPHVIQAQEAGGIYWYWDNNHTLNMNTTVFNRKYKFSALPSVGKKTWSQYNFSETEDITFTHQASGDNDPRTFTRSYLHFEGKDICILNTHCTYKGDFVDARQGQFQELATEMAQHEYCILCGDFNAGSPSEFNEFSAFNMANCGDYGVIDTWFVGGTSEWENHAIDNIITTKNILIQNVEIGKYDMDFFSDHVPLVATLKIIDVDSTTV